MKRQKRKNTPPKKTDAPPPVARRRRRLSRRELLGLLRFGAAAAVILGLGGWYVVSRIGASIDEHDLSRLGNGIPAVVQIHDRQCASCLVLEREVRKALGHFSEDEIQYLVVNMSQPQGRRFADLHRVGVTTLLFFDGRGRRRSSVSGVFDEATLKRAFEQVIEFNARGRS